MAHVGGIAHLALLAIVHDVQSGLDLLAHEVGDGPAHTRVGGGGVEWCSAIQGLQQGPEIIGTGQAPGMRGEDALGAALHDEVPPRTVRPIGVASSRKNFSMLAAAIAKASAAGTPAKSRSANGRVFGQSHSMCGKSVANMVRSTPMGCRSSMATRSTCCTLKKMCWRM